MTRRAASVLGIACSVIRSSTRAARLSSLLRVSAAALLGLWPLWCHPLPETGPQETAAWHREQGIASLQQHDIPGALDHFRRAVRLDPTDAASHDYLGVTLSDSGLSDQALAEFQKAVELDQSLAPAHYHLASAYTRANNQKEAVHEYEKALWLQPTMVEARNGLSAVCWKSGDLDGAIRLLQQIIDANPGFWEARYNLGLALWQHYRDPGRLPQKDDLEEAIRQLRAALQQQPGQPKIYLVLGQVLAETEDLAGGVEILRKGADLAHGDPEYLYNLGSALRMEGDLNAAEQAFRKTLQLRPDHAQARRALGLVLRQRGELEAAAAEFRRAASQQPTDAEIRHNLGSVLLSLNDLSGAIDELRQAVSLDPYYSEAHLTLAQALQKSGQPKEAQKERDEAKRIDTLRSNRGRAVVLLQAADGLAQGGDKIKAIEELRQAVQLSPDFPEAYFRLALTLDSSSASLDEIAAVLRKVIELDSDHALAHYRLGLVRKRQGRVEEAQAEISRASELAPGLCDAYLALAEAAVTNRDWSKALDEYVRYLAWEPNDEVVRRDLSIAQKNLVARP